MRDFIADLDALDAGGHVLLLAHSAPRIALEHLLRGVSLEEAVGAPNEWRAGWEYQTH